MTTDPKPAPQYARCPHHPQCPHREHCPLNPSAEHAETCAGLAEGAVCALTREPITGREHYDCDLDDATSLYHFWDDPEPGKFVRYCGKPMCNPTARGMVTSMSWRVTCTDCLATMSADDYAARARPPRGERALQAHVSPDGSVVWLSKPNGTPEPELPRAPRPPRPRRAPMFERTQREQGQDAWFRGLCESARLRPVRDQDGTLHVLAKLGDIYAYSADRLAFYLRGDTAHMKLAIMRKYVPEILTVAQEGDGEAVFTFEPQHLEQVAKLARCRFRVVLSPEERARRSERMAALNRHGDSAP